MCAFTRRPAVHSGDAIGYSTPKGCIVSRNTNTTMATKRLADAFDCMHIDEHAPKKPHIECNIQHQHIMSPTIDSFAPPVVSSDAFASTVDKFSQLTLAFRPPSHSRKQPPFDAGPVQVVPPHLLEIVDISSYPSIVFSASDFPTGTVTWMKILGFDFGKSYTEILNLYQGITSTSVHWRAVLDAGKDLTIASYRTYDYPLERYHGPSRSANEFEARKSIWCVKKGVWEAVIEFAQSPLQSSLKAVELSGHAGGLEDAVSEMENSGLFSPWSEVGRKDWGTEKIDHTRMLVSPFDPIMHGGLTVADLAEMEDF